MAFRDLVPFLGRGKAPPPAFHPPAPPTAPVIVPQNSLFGEKAIDLTLSILTQASDPDEVLRKAGISRPKLRLLAGDDEITAAMETRREALFAVPWQLTTEGDGGKESAPVKFITEQLCDHIEQILSGCMNALPYGYSVLEAVYEQRPDGLIGIDHISEKPFEWFIPRRELDGTVLYCSVQNPLGEFVDPRKFFLTVRGQTYKNPFGEALFSRLYWPWLLRAQGWRFWSKWLERFGTPMLVAEVNGDTAEASALLALAANDSVIAVRVGEKVTAIETASGGGQFESFERMCCARIQKVILGQTLTTDAGGSTGKSGSHALGKVHNLVREDRTDADVRMCSRTVQRIVDTLWTLNGFGDESNSPEFVMQDDTGIELERAQRDAALMTAGLKLQPVYYYRTYDYEPGDIDEAAMQLANNPPPPTVVAPAGTKPAANKGPAQVARPGTSAAAALALTFAAPASHFTPEQQAIEDGVAAALEHAEPPIATADIHDAIRGARDADDLVQRLAVLLPTDTTAFEQELARALFACDVMGYAHASEPAAQAAPASPAAQEPPQ